MNSLYIIVFVSLGELLIFKIFITVLGIFYYFCDQLCPSLLYTDSVMRKSISVEMRLAITSWFLATPAEYRTILHLFGVGRSTVCCIVHHRVKAIIT